MRPGVRLAAALRGDLRRLMEAELAQAETAVTAGIREAAEGLKSELRRQVTSAGLGERLARSWRSELYPKAGTSLGAAGLLWSKAPRIVRAFDEGAVIRSRSGLWLAVPTENAPKRGTGGKRVSPANFPEHRYGRLRFVYRPGGPSLLVVDGVRVKASGVSRRLKGGGRTTSGSYRKGVTTVVMFLLVPGVRLRKRLDVDRAAAHWADRLPGLIVRHMQALDRPGSAP